jgi:hypothetical protein
MNKIIYPNGTGGINIITAVNTDVSLNYIAAKDVPNGVPYLIVDAASLPTDRSTRAAWTADFSNPHGHGADFGNGSNYSVIQKEDNVITVRHEPTQELFQVTL